MKKAFMGLMLALSLAGSSNAFGVGAIAYSPWTTRWGIGQGINYNVAASNALGFCRAHDCRVAVWVSGGCAAVAAGWPRTNYGTGLGYNLYAAQANALANCNYGAQGCGIVAYVCSVN